MIHIVPAQAADLPAIDQLLDSRFGPARRRRTAYRLRDRMESIPALSLVARDGDALIGSVQCWPIQLTSSSGVIEHLTLLGPLVTAAEREGQGIGTSLLQAVLAAADATDTPPLILIGDEPYYGRFGFSASRTQHFILPGPVDHARLLMRGGDDLPVLGWLGPRDGVRRAA